MNELFLRKARIEDSRKVFDLRNHPEVRKHSHNTDKIDFDMHQDWFQETLLDNSRQVLIAQQGDDFVGMVRFDFIDNNYLLSWSISPKFQGRGLGKRMLNLASKTINGNLMAEIKQNNIASIKIAESIGMKLTKKKNNVLYYKK